MSEKEQLIKELKDSIDKIKKEILEQEEVIDKLLDSIEENREK